MRARSLPAVLAVAVALASSAAAPPVQAAPPAPAPAELANAKKLFEQGLKLYQEGSFREALAAFLHASDIAPRASLQRNIAQCHRDLKDFAAAHDAYQLLLGKYGATMSPADRKTIERAIEELAMLTGTVRVAVADPGAAVSVDGHEAGLTPLGAPLRLNLGAHVVTVSKAGFEPLRKELSLRGGDEVRVEGPLAPEVRTGRLAVSAPGASGAVVVVDGVEVGPAPWEGDVAPGAHTVETRVGLRTSGPRQVVVARRERTEQAISLDGGQARVQIDTHTASATILIDGKTLGAGVWEGPLPPGEHRLRIEGAGLRPYERAFLVHSGETFHEDARLESDAGAPSYEGVYSGIALLGYATPSGSSSFLAQACPSAPCTASSPLGGGLAVRVGYAFGWLAVEGMALGSYDSSDGKVTYPGTGPTDIPRTESYTFHRFGGGGAVGARVATKNPSLRLTASAMGGLVAMGNIYSQATSANVPGGGSASNTSSTRTYTAPLLAFDAGVLVGWPGGAKVHVALLTLLEFVGGPVLADPISKTGVGGGSYATPALQVASGTQVFVGPVVGFDLGL